MTDRSRLTRGLAHFVTLFFAMGTCSLAGQENWTSYRGPSDQGHAGSANLPIHWSEEKNVVWKTQVNGKAWSSPVIWEDRIFLTNAPEEGSRLSVLCIDKESGKVLYNKRLLTVPLPQYCHPFNSYASPSPVVEQGRVYVSFGSPYTACLESSSGEVIWQRTDFVCNHFRGPGSSPMLYKDRLFLHFDGSDQQYIVAMSKETGKTIWRTDRSVDYDDIDPKTGMPERSGDWRKAYSTPVVINVEGRPVLVSLGSMAIYGYDPDNGTELWRAEFVGSHSAASRPVLQHGLLYTTTGSGKELWAIRPDGRGVVNKTHVAWKHKRGVPMRGSTLVVGDLIYMVSDKGIAACVEAQTGKMVWLERIGSDFTASPIHANGRIYFMDQTGKATVLRAGREFKVLAVNQFDEGFMASPAVSGSSLFLRSRTHLYRIEDPSTE